MPSPSETPLLGNTDSAKSFDLVRSWIDRCLREHTECNANSDGWLPTRLIDIGSPDKEPRLRITSEHLKGQKDISYLTLSHCWGKAPHSEDHMTHLATLTKRQDAIPYSSLPRTFQDAITIGRNLSVPYLWIDTFCIIQDSEEDWEMEASSMAKVYSESLCTIAASSSDSWNGGCFVLRDTAKTTSCTLKWPSTEDGAEDEDVSLTIFSPLPREPLKTCPLNQRAWTLQERQLSRRNLDYTDIQIHWECRTWAATESNPEGGRKISVPSPNIAGYERTPYDDWRDTVDEYSSRELTHWTDRLTALSGLASYTEMALSGEKYLAGLWQGDLIKDLLWHCDPWTSRKRCSEYLGPTWSWASVIGPVGHPVFRNYLNQDLIDVSCAPSIIETHVSSGIDPFGRIQGASLQVSGCLRKVVYRKANSSISAGSLRCPFLLSGEENQIICGNFLPDCDVEPARESFYCLRMVTAAWPDYKQGQFTVLVLLPTGRAPNEFERYGYGKINDVHWFDSCKETVITLV